MEDDTEKPQALQVLFWAFFYLKKNKKRDNLFVLQMLNSSSEVVQVCTEINLLCLLRNKVREQKKKKASGSFSSFLSFENSFSLVSKKIQDIQQ